jgi:hypothetical protein
MRGRVTEEGAEMAGQYPLLWQERSWKLAELGSEA